MLIIIQFSCGQSNDEMIKLPACGARRGGAYGGGCRGAKYDTRGNWGAALQVVVVVLVVSFASPLSQMGRINLAGRANTTSGQITRVYWEFSCNLIVITGRLSGFPFAFLLRNFRPMQLQRFKSITWP